MDKETKEIIHRGKSLNEMMSFDEGWKQARERLDTFANDVRKKILDGVSPDAYWKLLYFVKLHDDYWRLLRGDIEAAKMMEELLREDKDIKESIDLLKYNQ